MSNVLTARPAAKINLFLDILRRRPDGFHDLHTCFTTVSLADHLRMEADILPAGHTHHGAPHVDLSVDGEFAPGAGPGPSNLVQRAVEALAAHGQNEFTASRLRMHLTKSIPHGAGLGGGSADAAAALLLANRFLAQPLDDRSLQPIAARIGSDCAFFLKGGVAEGSGRGEVLNPLPCNRRLYVLLVVPDFPISTKEAYGRLKPEMLGARSGVEGLRHWLQNTDAPLPRLENTFELALDPLYPALPRIREKLMECGAMIARLSGSGSASFGIFPDATARDEAAVRLAPHGRTFVCDGPAD